MSYFIHSPDEAESAFYSAFEHLDLQLMQSTWLDSEEVYCIHPGGPVQEGYEIVIRQWQFILLDAAPPQLNYRVVQKNTTGDTAVHLVEEQIGPAQQSTLVLATNIYRRTAEGWRMFAHHASLPPAIRSASATGVH